VRVSSIEIQTSRPISKKFTTVEDHDPGMVFVYVEKNQALGWLPETEKPSLTVWWTRQKIS
jgi:hypothetical protein